MKHLTFFSTSALALVFGIGLCALPVHAATATTMILTDTTKWSTGTTVLQSLNLSTNKLITLRKLPDSTTIRPQAFNGSRIVFSKNQDLYLGKITGGTDVRIAKFTGCTGDPSCTISAISFSHSGRYVLYQYEGYFLYDILTGRTAKVTKSFNIQGISPTDRFYFDNGYSGAQHDVVTLNLYRRSTLAKKSFALTQGYVGGIEIAPNELHLAWVTGGSTNATTNVTTPSVIHLTRLDNGQRMTSLQLDGATDFLTWINPESFIAIQTFNKTTDTPSYKAYLVTITNHQMTAKLIASIADRTITDVQLLDTKQVLLWSNYNDTASYFTLSTTGKLSKLMTVSNSNSDWFQLVGVKK